MLNELLGRVQQDGLVLEEVVADKDTSVKGGRTPPTQFFVDGCYARLLLLYTYRGFSTTTQGQSTCRRSHSLILERIWKKYQ